MTPEPAASAGEGVVADAASEPIATDEPGTGEPATEADDAASAAPPTEADSAEDEQPVAEAEATAGAPATEDETKA
jgi:hypothetical protein